MFASLKSHQLCWILLLWGIPSSVAQAQTPLQPPSSVQSSQAKPSRTEQIPITVRLESTRLLGLKGDSVLWTLELPSSASPLPQPVQANNTVWVAWGPILRGVRLETGRVTDLYYLPAPISSLEPAEGGVALEVDYGEGVKGRFTVKGKALEGRTVFLPTLEVTGALEKLASSGLGFNPLTPETNLEAVSILERRVQRDPLNPFLHLYLGRALQRSGQTAQALEHYRVCLSPSVPFFVSIRLARLLDGFGYSELADEALSTARANWTSLGYSPELAVSSAAMRAYGNPLGYALELDRSGANIRRDAWFRFLRDLTPRFEGFENVYARLADSLSAQGREGEALEIRAFSSSLNQGSLYNLGPVALDRARDMARLVVLSLLLALLMVVVSLGLRYSGQQRKALERMGGLFSSLWLHPLLRLRHAAFSYYTFSEKLVVLTLLISVGVGLSALGWAVKTQSRADDPALNLGTLGGPWFYARLERLNTDSSAPETALLEGLAAQLDGDESAARARYETQTAKNPPLAALENNLGVLETVRGDFPAAQQHYRTALSLEPGLDAASFNLRAGDNANLGSAEIPAQLEPPRLAYPRPTQIYRAVGGPWSQDLATLLARPWDALNSVPLRLSPPVKSVLIALYLLSLAVTLLWLLVPRPRAAGLPPRPWLFRTLSVLVPGLGLIDEVWGVLLLVPWCGMMLFGLSKVLILDFTALPFWSSDLSGTWWVLLGFLYVLNLVGILLEEIAHAGRLKRLVKAQGLEERRQSVEKRRAEQPSSEVSSTPLAAGDSLERS